MSAVIIYGSKKSTCVRRTAAVLNAIGQPYVIKELDWAKGEYKTPEHYSRHPFGRMPVIEFEGFTLYESRAIARFFALRSKSALLPDATDLKEVALFEQGASIEVCDFDPPASGIVGEKIFGPMFGRTPDEAVIKKHETKLENTLDAYERILSKQKYIGGNKLTIVDYFHLPYGSGIHQIGYSLTSDKRPNVARWWDEISQLEAWTSVQESA